MTVMNKKKIIIISSVIVAICVIIGLVQHFTNTYKNENETVSNSEVITESQPSSNSETTTDLITENETEVKDEQKENKNNNKNNKDNTGNKDTEKPNEDANDFPHQNNNPAENKPNNNNNNNKPPQKEEISVSLTISCRNALKYANIVDVPTSGYFLSTTNYTVKNGKSAFDLLSNACKENGISLYYEEKSYIKGIGGLNEKDCTPESGWMYRVNGNYINKAAIRYILNDGDKVEFYYVTSYKDVP